MGDRKTRVYRAPAGAIAGRVDGDVIRATGIPYARAERFEPPVPVTLLPGQPSPFPAFEPSPASPQLSSPVLEFLLEGTHDALTFSEHCQFLSITVPADSSPEDRLPVLVWIHGGSYVVGAGDLAIHDPSALVAEQRLIVVAVTYRLGVFGYLGDGEDVPANLGLLDQLEALRWIQRNIAAFGGDPSTVTVAGQSAGGDSVAHLIAANGAGGLFRRAVVQSAPLAITRRRSRMTRAMFRAVGPLSRTAPVEELLGRQAAAERAALRFGLRGGMPFGVQYGQAPLPTEAEIEDAWRSAARDVDLLIGTTSHETGLYLGVLPLVRHAVRWKQVRRALGAAVVRPTTALVYTRSARKFAERHRRAGGRALVYELRGVPSGSALGPVHAMDVALLFGSREAWAPTTFVGGVDWADWHARGRAMRHAWGDFAHTGSVSPAAREASSGTLVLDE